MYELSDKKWEIRHGRERKNGKISVISISLQSSRRKKDSSDRFHHSAVFPCHFSCTEYISPLEVNIDFFFGTDI